MKWMKSLFLVAFFLILGCGDDGLSNSDEYLIFGKYHNFCVGDCWKLYKLQNGALYADEFDHISMSEIRFQSRPMPEEAYLEAKTLFDELPGEIVNSTEERYGCPDCADQGGYYLSFKQNGQARIVHLDTQTDGFTPEIVTFLVEVERVLNLLDP